MLLARLGSVAHLSADRSSAAAKLTRLISHLQDHGFDTAARTGDKHSILLFVKLGSHQHLYAQVFRSRYTHTLFDYCIHSYLRGLVEYKTGCTAYGLHRLMRHHIPSKKNRSIQLKGYASFIRSSQTQSKMVVPASHRRVGNGKKWSPYSLCMRSNSTKPGSRNGQRCICCERKT